MHKQPRQLQTSIRPSVWFIVLAGFVISLVMINFRPSHESTRLDRPIAPVVPHREPPLQFHQVSEPVQVEFSVTSQDEEQGFTAPELSAIREMVEDRRTWFDPVLY